jgi:hypothetical protein
MRRLFLIACAVLLCEGCSIAMAEDPKKDAAEEVGEGNAARWLDYYRRERGQQWDPKPGTEGAAGKSAGAPEPREPVQRDSIPQPERR